MSVSYINSLKKKKKKEIKNKKDKIFLYNQWMKKEKEKWETVTVRLSWTYFWQIDCFIFHKDAVYTWSDNLNPIITIIIIVIIIGM